MTLPGEFYPIAVGATPSLPALLKLLLNPRIEGAFAHQLSMKPSSFPHL